MGKNTPKKNRNIEIAADQNMIDGFNKHASALTTLVINGATQSAQQITGTFQSRIDSAKEVMATKATWNATLLSDKELRDATKTYVSGARQGVMVAFAGHPDVLADFGLTPRAKPVLTPDEAVARTAKAKATRAARHTMGPKQKLAIKGTVVTTSPATTTPPAIAPIPAASPASPAAPIPAASPASPAAPIPAAPPASPAAPIHAVPPAVPAVTSPAAPPVNPAPPTGIVPVA
jgi:hypothetical protein